ncbi:MAG: ATP-binding protein [Treponema sp.]|jgi:predicted AAA+ superfamily ATPase|nr:ATP-binding protein [Treponema sp.]
MAETAVLRKEYLERLVGWREKAVIKVITGVRRCGKSTLLSQYMEYLRSSAVPDDRIVFVNLEDLEYRDLLTADSLYAYIKNRLSESAWTYVFIDEVQQCAEFERAVDSLFIQKNVDLYITGSNAYMLSGELATLLSGRYVELSMLPLSFAEYAGFTGALKDGPAKAFDSYLSSGSFPYIAVLLSGFTGPRDMLIRRYVRPYIEGIYNTILIKDVAKREQIRDTAVLQDIVRFLCSAIGSPISARNIANTLNSGGRKISVNTVEACLGALRESFIFYRISRFDIKGKEHLKTLGKYYIVDTGIRDLLLAASSADLGHLLENVICLELMRRGFKVNTGKVGEKEVDFVAQGPGGTSYYQAAASVLDPAVLERELAPLRKIEDNHPKYLLTLDEYMNGANYDGIRQFNAVEWLLGR